MSELRIKQVRSANGANPRQRAALRSLRLGRIGKSVSFGDTVQIRGTVRVVEHLVEVQGGDA